MTFYNMFKISIFFNMKLYKILQKAIKFYQALQRSLMDYRDIFDAVAVQNKEHRAILFLLGCGLFLCFDLLRRFVPRAAGAAEHTRAAGAPAAGVWEAASSRVSPRRGASIPVMPSASLMMPPWPRSPKRPPKRSLRALFGRPSDYS